MATELSAEVQCVTFFNEENNYLIARVRSKDEPGPFSIVGHLARVTPGPTMSGSGFSSHAPRRFPLPDRRGAP